MYSTNKQVLNDAKEYFAANGNSDGQRYIDLLLNGGNSVQEQVNLTLVEDTLKKLRTMVHYSQFDRLDEMCRLYIDQCMPLGRLLNHPSKSVY